MKKLNPKTAIICSILLVFSIVVVTIAIKNNTPITDESRSESGMQDSSPTEFVQENFSRPKHSEIDISKIEPFSFEIKREFSSRTEVEEEMQRLQKAYSSYGELFDFNRDLYRDSEAICQALYAELYEIAETIPFTDEERHKKKVELLGFADWNANDNLSLVLKENGVILDNKDDKLDFEENYRDRITKNEYYEYHVNHFEEVLTKRNTIRQAKADYEAGKITVDEALKRADRHIDFYESRGQEVPEFLR